MKLFKDKINTLRYAFSITRKYNKKFAAMNFISSLLMAVSPLIPTYFTAKLIDELAGDKNIERLITYAILMTVITFAFMLINNFLNISLNKMYDAVNWLESKIFMEKIISLDFELLENKKFQDNVKAYKNAFASRGSVCTTIWYRITSIFSGFMSIIFSVILVREPIIQCLKIDNSNFITTIWPLVILIVTVGILASVMAIMGGKMQKDEAKLHLEINKNVGIYNYWMDFPQKYRNGKEIRVFGAKKLILRLSDKHFNNSTICYFNAMGKARMKTLTINYVLQAIIMGAFFLFVAVKAYAGLFSVGDLAMFIGIATTISGSVSLISQIPYLMGVECTTIGYLKNVLETSPVKSVGKLHIEKHIDNKFEIEFKNVSFKYPGTENMILKNLSVKLTIGERLAIVGMNGSGKTTFIKLLCRLYDPTEGEILLNGIDIKKYNFAEYMGIFSVVFQDFKLFAVPLCQNVATSVNYNKERLWDSLSKAGIDERVKEMPLKEKTPLYKNFDDKGFEISGGEAQKLALARAFYKDAPFIILDEPTAALDPIAEYEIYERFNSFVGEKTAIYISHRLSSCRFCDKIGVFHDGELVQFGLHDALVSDDKGKYYELWNSQAQYYTN